MALYDQYGIPFLIFCTFVRSQELPSFSESYTAIGEITAVLAELGNITMQLRFEENYDVEKRRASLRVTQLSQDASFVEYFDAQETFQYNKDGCKVFTPEDWITIGSPPDIRPYETDRGNIIFPLRQLINLTTSTLLSHTHTSFRRIPAFRYQHRLAFDFEDTKTTIDIDAYWSDGNWNTSSKNKVVPLGFITHRTTYNSTSKETNIEQQFISIFYFAHGAVDMEAFKVREGILCHGIKQSIPFPNAENLTVFSFSTEFQWVGYDSVSTVDSWWDSKNRLLRVDFDPLRQPQPQSKKQFSVSDVISHYQGTVYRITDEGNRCDVSPLDIYEFDYQNIIDVRSEGVWLKPVTNFFGLEESSMIYIGDTVKRGIPCSIWQGERIDWPSTQRPTVTVWEWCIANGKEKNVKWESSWFPLVNLEITIIQSSGKDPAMKDGMKMTYGFYNVKNRSPGSMDALAFDLFPCFIDNHIKLMFAVEYNSSLLETLNKTLVSNADFFALWKAEINHAAGLSPQSLRIAQLRTRMYGKNLVVKFILLGVHPALTADIKQREKSLIAARQSLESAINSGKLYTEWIIPKEGKLILKAIPNSLTEEEAILITPTTIPPTKTTVTDELGKTSQPTTETDEKVKTTVTDELGKTSQPTTETDEKVKTNGTKVIERSSTEPINTASHEDGHSNVITTESYGTTSSPSPKVSLTNKPRRYSPGIMALVAFIMLFAGVGVGASGTYYKIKKM